MIFDPAKDALLAAELRELRDEGGTPTLLLICAGEPINVGLDDDELVILPPERVLFDVAAGYRLEPPPEGSAS